MKKCVHIIWSASWSRGEWIIDKWIYLVHYLLHFLHESYQMWNGYFIMRSTLFYAVLIFQDHLQWALKRWHHSMEEKKITHDLTSGWCKAAVGQHRWDPPRQLGLQHLRPEELRPGRSAAVGAGAHSCRGDGPMQYRGPPPRTPQWPAGSVPSPRRGLC